MKFEPSSVADLRLDIDAIKPEFRAKMRRTGALTENQLISFIGAVTSDIVEPEHPSETDFVRHDSLFDCDPAIEAIEKGKVAYVVLAGGAGTRAGGPKAFMRLPKLGMTLMANKLFGSSVVKPNGVRIQAEPWFMTSPELMEKMARHLCGLSCSGVVFDQFESYRLNAMDRVDFKEHGVPHMGPTGHGDVGPALVESGLLNEFQNVKYCVISNCDNVLGSLDLEILSRHIENGNKVTCEVIERTSEDKGGIVAWADNKLQAIESFRLPVDDLEDAKYHNTNSMIINVDVLKSDVNWRWYRLRKHVDNKIVVQYERLLQQYTELFKTEYVLVDRNKRYLPVKVESDLQRADEILNANKRW